MNTLRRRLQDLLATRYYALSEDATPEQLHSLLNEIETELNSELSKDDE